MAIIPPEDGETTGRVVEFHGSNDPASVIRWTNETIFHSQEYIHVGKYPDIVTDIDADGITDSITFLESASQIVVHRSGQSEPITTSFEGGLLDEHRTVTADFNGDGTIDIFSWDGRNTQTILSNSDYTFQPALIGSLPSSAISILAADFDGDGSHTIFFGYGVQQLNLYRAYTADFSAGEWLYSREPKLDDGAFTEQVVDLNRDGFDDIVGPRRVYYGSEDGIGDSVALPNLYRSIQVGDFDGDGSYDLVGAPLDSSSEDTSQDIHVLTGNSDGTFTKTRTIETDSAQIGATNSLRANVGDVDKDGLDDIFIESRNFQPNQDYYFASGEDLSTVVRYETVQPVGSYPAIRRSWLVDVNGDSYLDLVQSASTDEKYFSLYSSVMLDVIFGSAEGFDVTSRRHMSLPITGGNVRSVERVGPRLRVIVGHQSGQVILESYARDLNQDGELSADDIDLLCQRVHSANSIESARFDFNDDEVIDHLDVDLFLNDVIQIQKGDVDLDGDVDFADFLALSTNYGNDSASWSGGNFTCDQSVDEDDFAILKENYGS